MGKKRKFDMKEIKAARIQFEAALEDHANSPRWAGEEFYEARINNLELVVSKLHDRVVDLETDITQLIQIVDPGLPNPPSAAEENALQVKELREELEVALGRV